MGNDTACDLGQLQARLHILKSDICSKIDSLSSDLRVEISSVREELTHAIESVQQKTAPMNSLSPNLSTHPQTTVTY